MARYEKVKAALLKEGDISYYILGVFATDGSVRFKNRTGLATECELFSEDDDWIHHINQTLGNEALAIKKGNGTRIRYWNKEIFDWFNTHGCTPNKSLDLKFPNIPCNYLPDFLRGCIDGDGSISSVKYKKILKSGKEAWYTKINTYLCGSSLDFLNDFSKILDEKNINYSFINKTNKTGIKYKYPHYRVHMNDSNAKKFLEWIYYPGNRLSMPRKQRLANEILSIV